MHKKRENLRIIYLFIFFFFEKCCELKGAFGLAFLVTQFSVSITHNSKMVGLIAKRLFGK